MATALQIVGLLAALAALVTFIQWGLNLRRRPEVEFLWRISLTGAPAGFQSWPAAKSFDIRVGQTILVEASIHNSGDATGDRALTNFVVPDCFSLDSYGTPTPATVLQSTNEIAGQKPNDVVRFIAGERPFYVDIWWMHRFSLTLETAPLAGGARLLMEMSEDRLNSRGRRLVPSLALAKPPPPAPYGTHWTAAQQRRALRWIRAHKADAVSCRAGTRQTVRDLRVVPRRSGAPAA